MTFRAYFDDSGSHRESSHYVVGGYAAAAAHWADFEKEWREALDEEPSILYLHTWESRKLDKQFKGWSHKDANAKVVRLASLIRRHSANWYEFSVCLSRATFDRAAQMRRFPVKTANPYYLCYLTLMIQFLSNGDKVLPLNRDGIEWVFDKQPKSMDIVQTLHAKFRDQPEYRSWVGSLTFRNDRVAIPLQAADLLAWTLRRLADNKRIPDGFEQVLCVPAAMRIRLTPEQIEHYVLT